MKTNDAQRSLRSTLPALSIRAWLRLATIAPFLNRIPAGARVLEVGAGIGGFACRLCREFDYTGLELDQTSWAIAAARVAELGTGRVIHGDLKALGPDERFALVCAFEVLEHMEDDRQTLAEWALRIAPGGALLISVPAFERRFNAWDLRAGHYRRYDPDQLRSILDEADLSDIDVRAYGAPIDLILEHARNLIARLYHLGGSYAARTASSGRALQPPEALAWLTRAVSAPFRRISFSAMQSRWGTGLVAFALRPD